MTKATLHDEMMREAGFTTDDWRELEHRRERRRRSVLRAVIALAWLVLVVALVVQFADIQTRHRVVPESLAIAAFIVAPAVHGAIRLMKRRRSRRKEGGG